VDNIQVSGQPASFWVTAAGAAPLRYQWQKNGENIPGAAANCYTAPPAASADNGATFRAIVGNNSGSVTSTAAKLTVNAAPGGPAIGAQPANQTVAAGQPASFSVGASGTPLRYQWRKNGVDIAGATTASLVIPAAITADSGASYSVAVADGSGSATSTRATLAVTAAPGAPILLTNPARARVLPSQTATFSVAAWSGSPMRYQWQKGTFGGNMADIPGATDAAYTTPPTTLSDHLTLFRCVVSNAAGSATSAGEMLFVTAAPTPPSQITSPIAVSIPVGKPFQYTIVLSGGTSPIAYSASPLPDGLSVGPASGRISGTPTATGATRVAIHAGNSAGDASAILNLTVTDAPPATSIGAWRRANFGVSATDPSIAGDAADPDGDGYANLHEFLAGSNPLDATSVPGSRMTGRRRLPPN
jgi:hypothetical protein